MGLLDDYLAFTQRTRNRLIGGDASAADSQITGNNTAPTDNSPGLPGSYQSGAQGSAPSFAALDAADNFSDPLAGVPVSAADLRRMKERNKPTVTDVAPLTGSAIPFSGASAGLLSGQPSPTPDIPPATNDPTSGEPQVFSGGVPVPRPRPISANTPAPDQSTDLSSSSAPPPAAPLSMAPPQPAAPDAQPQAAGNPFGGIGDVIGKILQPQNAPLLMSLAGGFSGAPSLGTGMRRAFSGAAPATMQLAQFQQTQQTQAATYKALIDKGVPPADAMAAVRDPNVMKATAAKYFETKPFVPHKIGTDAMGNDIMGSFNPNTNQFHDAAGRPIGANGSASGVNIPDAGAGMFAKGVTELNQDLPADEFKAQFSPSVQAQMDAYIHGDTMPTGNPRQKGSAVKIKEWAQLYGNKAGIPVSDAAFSEKRKYQTELGSNSAATAGGQVKAFNQGIEHAAALANKLEGLGNVDPVGIPMVSGGLNTLRQAFSTKQSGLAKEAQAIGQTLAGEVGKLFSGSAGGGVHERELTRNRFNTVSSPTELAGALEGTLETMDGGLKALEQRRDQVLGPNSGKEFVNKETRDKIAKIQEVIQRLKSGTSAPAAKTAPPAGKTSTGIQWSIVQ